ncbi:hypothetical protein FQZ97_471730 [compost metagenome]
MQLLDHLRHLAALHHLFFQAIEQPIALRITHAEFEIGAGQRFLVAGDVLGVEQGIEVALVVQHQAQVDLRLGLEVLVDGAFANAHGVGDHLDGDAVFPLLEEQLQRGVEDLLLTAAKFANLSGFFLHKETARSKSEGAYYAYLA